MQAKATKKCVADITATDLARPPPHHALAALEDRSMSEESNKQCSICFRRYTEFGHPAEPVKSGRCCNACNDLVVIPARLRAMREATVAPPALTAGCAQSPPPREGKPCPKTSAGARWRKALLITPSHIGRGLPNHGTD